MRWPLCGSPATSLGTLLNGATSKGEQRPPPLHSVARTHLCSCGRRCRTSRCSPTAAALVERPGSCSRQHTCRTCESSCKFWASAWLLERLHACDHCSLITLPSLPPTQQCSVCRMLSASAKVPFTLLPFTRVVRGVQALWGARLKERRPLQYLLSCAHWWKITLAVGPGCVLPLVRRSTLWVEAACRVCHQAADACARGVPPAPGAVAWYTAGTVQVACLALLAGTFYLTCCGKALPANQFVAAYSITAPAPFFCPCSSLPCSAWTAESWARERVDVTLHEFVG